MKTVEQLDEEAMTRIAHRVRKLMRERYGIAVNQWLIDYSHYTESMARYTWQAAREEFAREEMKQ